MTTQIKLSNLSQGVVDAFGGGGGAANLSTSYTSGNVTVNSDKYTHRH